MYLIKAVFRHEDGTARFTIYDEVQFTSREVAGEWLDGEYGEQLAQVATIESKSEPELAGCWFEDLIIEESN
jgi:hypothetical protein